MERNMQCNSTTLNDVEMCARARSTSIQREPIGGVTKGASISPIPGTPHSIHSHPTRTICTHSTGFPYTLGHWTPSPLSHDWSTTPCDKKTRETPRAHPTRGIHARVRPDDVLHHRLLDQGHRQGEHHRGEEVVSVRILASSRRVRSGSIDARAERAMMTRRDAWISRLWIRFDRAVGRRAPCRARGRSAESECGDISHGKSSVGVARDMARWRARRCATVAFWARAGSSLVQGSGMVRVVSRRRRDDAR